MMLTLSISVFLAYSISLSHAISRYNVTNSSCEEDAEMCQNHTSCLTIFQDYLTACSDVFNHSNDSNIIFDYQEGSCPEQCNEKLFAYLDYLYPEETSTEFCTCGSENCNAYTQQLYDQRCIASDCSNLYQMCMNDTNCNPIAHTYANACAPLGFFGEVNVSWDHNYCPAGCAEALDAYVSYIAPNYTSIHFCDCNGDPICENAKNILAEKDCVNPVCGELHEMKCVGNTECEDAHYEYIRSCESLVNGSWTEAWCPADCKSNLFEYLIFIADDGQNLNNLDGICSCEEADGKCQHYKDTLKEKGCIKESCGSQWYNCQNDPVCQPLSETYLMDCAVIINQTYTGDTCPGNCQASLAAYLGSTSMLQQVINEEYCDCEGDQACEDILQMLIDVECIPQNCEYQFAMCTFDNNCQALAEGQQTACVDELSGTATSCSPDCRIALSKYLDYMYPDINQETAGDYCECSEGNTECVTAQGYLDTLNCVDFSDCSFKYFECTEDVECQLVAEQYFAACQIFVDQSYDGSYEECPKDCSDALSLYIDTVFGFQPDQNIDQYCNCNDEANCVTVMEWFNDLDCLDKVTTTTSTFPPSGANQLGIQLSLVFIGMVKLFFV